MSTSLKNNVSYPPSVLANQQEDKEPENKEKILRAKNSSQIMLMYSDHGNSTKNVENSIESEATGEKSIPSENSAPKELQQHGNFGNQPNRNSKIG